MRKSLLTLVGCLIAVVATADITTYFQDNDVYGTAYISHSTTGPTATLYVDDLDVDDDVSIGGDLTVTGSLTGLATNSVVDSLTVNGSIVVDLAATSDEIAVTQTNAAGTADTPLLDIDDDRTGATANTVGEATVHLTAAGVYALAVEDGAVAVESIIDTYAAGALSLGPATATSVSIGASDIDTTVLGPLNVLEATGKGIDTTGAGALYLGEAVATSVVLGASDADTTVAGDLIVTGLDIDSAAGAMTVGKAAATSLALGASDITTTINGTTVASGALWLGTNGYFQVVGNALQFVGHNSFTNEIDADITQ